MARPQSESDYDDRDEAQQQLILLTLPLFARTSLCIDQDEPQSQRSRPHEVSVHRGEWQRASSCAAQLSRAVWARSPSAALTPTLSSRPVLNE